MNMVYRGGRKVSDPRTTKHWVIKVNGSTKVDVGPGENVEIGRRPLRPLADDGHRRLEIDDDTRSMSKRHAVFTVAANGGASLTDLSSTNGTYVVDEKGLRPLTPNQDFILPDSPMRLQFGDVPVDFVRVEVDESPEDDNQVTDLFDYAASDGGSADVEPDLNEMSVDDILNLRAGEPTTAFSAADVADRIEASSNADTDGNADAQNANGHTANENSANAEEPADEAAPSDESGINQKPGDSPIEHTIDEISLNVMTPEPQVEDAKARDLFKDAMTSAADDQAEESAKSADAGKTASQPAANDTAAPAESISSPDGSQARRVSLPSRRNDGQSLLKASGAQQPTATQLQPNVNGGAIDASSVQQGQAARLQSQQVASPQQVNRFDAGIPESQITAQRPAGGYVDGGADSASDRQDSLGVGGTNDFNGNTGSDEANRNGTVYAGRAERRTGNGVNSVSEQAPVGQGNPIFAMDERPRRSDGGGARPRLDFSASQHSQNDSAESKTAEKRNKFMPPVREATDSPRISTNADDGTFNAQQGFKPTFEPGSVFEKVSNGEFDQPQPEVEVGDMSSLEAKTTTDFSRQFEMAKQPELLPFLAMNPSLYDDLYAWLSAVGNDDVDAALSQNSGYIEYRNEVGEGRRQ
ncbi:FHA domain-containing protein [Bifidobacterium sp. ESL0704]|uniref:variant leucine-rich repeat-containing protein n=1 Tax=Bifidobacterium sp. ESL0704 TaxID=2983219 RepID=UPI0023F99967|nr:FHA domain-containing protein [Bifidobacterium sp. ESL0704]WEV52673.1 FHA domain-containing protein [Bifidobacterium sp. ESL0704]